MKKKKRTILQIEENYIIFNNEKIKEKMQSHKSHKSKHPLRQGF